MNEDSSLPQNGDLVEDILTGTKGVVVCKSEWLHGCDRVSIQRLDEPFDKDGKQKDLIGYDIPQVKILEKGYYFRKKNETAASEDEQAESFKPEKRMPRRKAGGPQPEPSRGR